MKDLLNELPLSCQRFLFRFGALAVGRQESVSHIRDVRAGSLLNNACLGRHCRLIVAVVMGPPFALVETSSGGWKDRLTRPKGSAYRI